MLNSKITIDPLLVIKSISYRLRSKEDPYIPSFHRLKCIFVHIPRTGGISVEKALFGEKVNHHRAVEYLYYKPLLFRRYFSFTFVRNPWDRLVSAFFFLKQGGRNQFDKSWSDLYLSDINDFSQFLLKLSEDKSFRNIVTRWIHFQPQYMYITDKWNNIIVDFVGRFENLMDDFRIIMDRLGIITTLPHLNRSRHENYRTYYDDDTEEIVRTLYQKDIELLGYEW